VRKSKLGRKKELFGDGVPVRCLDGGGRGSIARGGWTARAQPAAVDPHRLKRGAEFLNGASIRRASRVRVTPRTGHAERRAVLWRFLARRRRRVSHLRARTHRASLLLIVHPSPVRDQDRDQDQDAHQSQ
jgi:hypothetical protein